jgi:hypothetical protein
MGIKSCTYKNKWQKIIGDQIEIKKNVENVKKKKTIKKMRTKIWYKIKWNKILKEKIDKKI